MLAVLLVLYIGSQLLSSILMSVTADKNQRYLMIGLPFIFVFFIKGFPAGLLVYWITTNLWTVGQQYFIRRSTGQLPKFLGGDGALPAMPAAGAAALARAEGRARGTPKAESSNGKPAAPPARSAAGSAQEEEALGEAALMSDSGTA